MGRRERERGVNAYAYIFLSIQSSYLVNNLVWEKNYLKCYFQTI